MKVDSSLRSLGMESQSTMTMTEEEDSILHIIYEAPTS